jgi:hypothetical protein
MNVSKVVFILFFLAFQAKTIAKADTSKYNFFKNHEISIQTLSYVKHLGSNDPSLNEGFGNRLFIAGLSVDEQKKTKILFGFINNSFNDKCMLLGISHNWIKLSDKFDFVGMYAYVGEIPGIACQNCGNEGVYNTVKKSTGIGFAPYIWHGISYKIMDNFKINSGIIFPHVATINLEFVF